jgi:Zn-dependent protease
MQNILILILIFLPAVILHEYAHGWVAYKLGDPTAKSAGRLTLNPLKHVDPVGTILLPALLILMRSPILFGWAKPVPVNFMNLDRPKRDMLWVGIAGPVVNILLAVTLSLLLKFELAGGLREILGLAILVNLVLAVFNMIPIPPLDGSRLVMSLLPLPYARSYAKLEPYGILIVFALLYFGLLDEVVWPLVVSMAQALGVAV